MIRITLLLSIITFLTGCALNAPASSPAGAVVTSAPVQAVPVFVIPNCQSISGEQRCYWIEPRGFHRSAPTKTTTKQVQGISL
jgi:hypothetical protein